MVAETAASNQPAHRVILLGASNLARGIATVIETCRRLWGGPLEILGALGHGRSYGATSSVLGRSLTGILQSELWPALAARQALPTTALVTDIGNDLMYEAPVEQIAAWVERCLDELLRRDVRIVMTRLPVANIDHVPEWKFRLLRRLMFPKGGLPYATIAARARELDERLVDVAASRNVTLVEQQRAWYGWDPIHLKSRVWPTAWHTILSPLAGAAVSPAPKNPGLAQTIYLRSRTPARRWWFGIEQRGRQPCARLADSSVISFY